MKNVLFYNFVDLGDLEKFKVAHKKMMKRVGVLGKVLVSEEGINGNVSGTQDACQQYMQEVLSVPGLEETEFKVTDTDKHDFHKVIVRVRPEIITMKTDYDLSKKAQYIEPEQLKELYESGEDFVILDTRNDYESRIGKFENSIAADISLFSEFPDYLEEIKHLKDKKIVTYCTGGIRCEKATAVMREHGFDNIYQLHGGIIEYGKKVGSEHWEGKCFVFDDRKAIDIADSQAPVISKCDITGKPAAQYYNCRNPVCDEFFIASPEGIEKFDGACCQQCLDADTQRLAQKAPISS